MRQPASIFNNVIGPVMVGPSSSHTAASVRIGYLLQSLCHQCPQRLVFSFSSQGSLASCHEGQGTDMGLAAGLLGLELDSEMIMDALSLARSSGMDIEFLITDEPVPHPNTYQVYAEGDGPPFQATFISVGGGMIELIKLDGFDISIDGGYYETLFVLGKCSEIDAIAAKRRLSSHLQAYEEISHCGDEAGRWLINVKSTAPLSQREVDLMPSQHIWQLPPVLPIASRKSYSGLFNTAAEILDLTIDEGWQLWQAAARYESRRGNISEAEVFERMRALLHIMRRSISRAEHEPPDYEDRILGPQAYLLARSRQLPNQTLNQALRCITLLMEAKSAMLPIVAAPTAGACAALPGTIIGAAEALDLDEDEMVKALLAAAMIGVLIAEHATFAAELSGCQAECGAASGMAAAGLVQLQGGAMEQTLCAASLALQNMFGLVCDPVAQRVEVPCLGRNIMAGANAVAMANLALAGFDEVIPLDETIAAMFEVGQAIDSRLRCTCGGGLSQTPTSLRIADRLEENKSNPPLWF